jgi:hypothetical protein
MLTENRLEINLIPQPKADCRRLLEWGQSARIKKMGLIGTTGNEVRIKLQISNRAYRSAMIGGSGTPGPGPIMHLIQRARHQGFKKSAFPPAVINLLTVLSLSFTVA